MGESTRSRKFKDLYLARLRVCGAQVLPDWELGAATRFQTKHGEIL